MKQQRKSRKQMSAVERSIDSRERGIARMKQNIDAIRRKAEKEIADASARIAEKQILLDALKRGSLKASA